VCGTAESTLFHDKIKLFSQNGRVVMLVMYGIGIIVFIMAIPNYVHQRPGFFAVVIRKVPTRLYCVKAAVLFALCVPFYAVMIYMVEDTVRRESQRTWMESTGQWLALGLGITTVLEATWHVGKGIDGELRGRNPFRNDVRFLGDENLKSVIARRLSCQERLASEQGRSTSSTKHRSEEDLALISIPVDVANTDSCESLHIHS
jgi:hypothetical protein